MTDRLKGRMKDIETCRAGVEVFEPIGLNMAQTRMVECGGQLARWDPKDPAFERPASEEARLARFYCVDCGTMCVREVPE